jgi:hypothetical protein
MSMVSWWQLVKNGCIERLRRIFGSHIVELVLRERSAGKLE